MSDYIIYDQDRKFLNDLEDAVGNPISLLDKDVENKTGFILEGSRIVSLNLYYLSRLEAIPESIGNLDFLRKLRISECRRIRNLPETIFDLPNLKILDINSCDNVSSLPENISKLDSLEQLIINYCYRLRNLPENIGDLNSLTTLKITNCYNMNTLPESIFNLKSLKILIIKQELSSIPNILGNLESLQELTLENCYNIENLPESIGDLKNLDNLKIKYLNKLKLIPNSLCNLKHLKIFELSNCNSLKALPENFGNIETLQRLKLSNCSELENLPESVGKLKVLVDFEIYNCRKLGMLPVNFIQLKSLQKLEINECESLKSLPEKFGKLDALKELFLKGCRNIGKLPKSFGDLKSIIDLKIEQCRNLESFPKSFNKLKSLKKLSLINCERLKSLPEKINNLTSLEQLILIGCPQLKQLHNSIGYLKNLKVLNFKTCKNLEINPEIFTNLPSIEAISIVNCILTKHPKVLNTLRTLKKLELSDNIYSPILREKIELIRRGWKKEYEPWRSIVLWGWDESKNPSLVILYGRHNFAGIRIDVNTEEIEAYLTTSKKKREITPGIYDVLKENVDYTSYVLWRGKNGHFPSFKRTKIIQKSHYDYKQRTYTTSEPEMYYKSGLSYSWGWRVDSDKKIATYYNLPESKQVSLPYFETLSYSDYVSKVKSENIPFEGFTVANSHNEVLKFDNKFSKYIDLFTNIITNQNIYMRKKYMKELLDKNPPKEIYYKILEIGSSELISGLFLELAKIGSPVLSEEAKILFEKDIDWTEENYAKGVKRCARLYLNSMDPNERKRRSDQIRKELPELEIKLKKVEGRDIKPDKILTGSQYRRYAQRGAFREYRYSWDYEAEDYVKKLTLSRYKSSLYTDGLRLDYIRFKNLIQEAEIYQLADVIGKIAYYIDAPRLYYYFQGSGHGGALRYYQRYVRRIINNFAKTDELKFMEAMKHLLTSYTPIDFLGKFPENFQFNIILKYYLYHEFREQAPQGWRERWEWISNDQLVKLEGRYEFEKEIWDRHLDVVIEIAKGAQIDSVLRSCYFILKDSPNSEEFIKSVHIKQLIELSLNKFKPLSEMFATKIQERIDSQHTFTAELMLALMESPSNELHEIAIEFFNRTKGTFTPETLVKLLFLGNIERWSELFNKHIMELNADLYSEFIKYSLLKLHDFIRNDIELPEAITNSLTLTTLKINDLLKEKKAELFESISDTLFHESKIPHWLATYLEELIFSISFKDLDLTAKEMKLEFLGRAQSSRNNRILSILKALKFKKLPTDSEIVDIIDFGTSKMMNVFILLVSEYKEQLKERFSTVLIMSEAEISIFNKIASEIFESLPSNEQKKLHSLIIDSPVKRTYSYGLRKLDEIYEGKIPGDFIIQMFEHSASEVKAYISDKINRVINNFGNGDKDLFMYYIKTLAFLPNLHTKSKDKLYEVIPQFTLQNKDKLPEIEEILLEIGNSNIIIDSERALVALAKIKKEVDYS